MKNCIDYAILEEYVMGKLSAEQSNQIWRHVHECKKCYDYISFLEEENELAAIELETGKPYLSDEEKMLAHDKLKQVMMANGKTEKISNVEFQEKASPFEKIYDYLESLFAPAPSFAADAGSENEKVRNLIDDVEFVWQSTDALGWECELKIPQKPDESNAEFRFKFSIRTISEMKICGKTFPVKNGRCYIPSSEFSNLIRDIAEISVVDSAGRISKGVLLTE